MRIPRVIVQDYQPLHITPNALTPALSKVRTGDRLQCPGRNGTENLEWGSRGRCQWDWNDRRYRRLQRAIVRARSGTRSQWGAKATPCVEQEHRSPNASRGFHPTIYSISRCREGSCDTSTRPSAPRHGGEQPRYPGYVLLREKGTSSPLAFFSLESWLIQARQLGIELKF
jgi:hypothetical protein